jgi:hypothetical protein
VLVPQEATTHQGHIHHHVPGPAHLGGPAVLVLEVLVQIQETHTVEHTEAAARIQVLLGDPGLPLLAQPLQGLQHGPRNRDVRRQDVGRALG